LIKNFKLSLVNKDPQLDLTDHKEDIAAAIQYINAGKSRKKDPVFINVNEIKLLSLNKSYLELEADYNAQDDQAWKQKFGWFLKHKRGMSSFCNPKDPKEMFLISPY